LEATPLVTALALATLAGATIPLGAWLATLKVGLFPDWLANELRHGIIAFGAGALLAAVALVLLPEGSARLNDASALFWFLMGGAGFAVVDTLLAANGSKMAQFLAMIMDYLPEALALGALISGDMATAVLVACLIGLQNLPEGFNAMREMSQNGSVRLWPFLAMVPLGPLLAYVGLILPAEFEPLIGAVMMIASGGILFLVFQDIAPQVPLQNHTLPTLGAVMGFALGLAGHLAI